MFAVSARETGKAVAYNGFVVVAMAVVFIIVVVVVVVVVAIVVEVSS